MADEPCEGPEAGAPAPVILQPGQVVQGYEIVKPLGKGKFSIVYMAKRLSDGLLCAMKKINIFDMMVPKQREKCLKEVRLLQSLDHPNIVKLLSSLIDNNDLLIIVEWAEKGDLKRLIRKAVANDSRFKEPEIWEYSRQLAGALDHMHKKRIMHRDLKPANIFVSMDGSLKLGDLGLGRFFSSQTLEAFSKVGTPLYMSPEVLHGAGYDMRSDVWSLGCVIYELAMLRSPFKSDQQLSLYDLFVRISKGQYSPLPENMSLEFRGLVNQMLQLDPSRRLESSQVLEVCIAQAKLLAAGPSCSKQQAQASTSSETRSPCRPSPLLIMDDIVEKLKLLECENLLLHPRGFPLLHRCFFTQHVDLPGPATQFDVMCELILWLLDMLKAGEARAGQQEVLAADACAGPCIAPSRGSVPVVADPSPGDAAAGGMGAGDAAAGGCSAPPARSQPVGGHVRGDDSAVLTREIVAGLKCRGIQISSETTMNQLNQGFGEGVCLIINELINQELMGRDFHFTAPVWGAAAADGACSPVGSVADVTSNDLELSQRTASATRSESQSDADMLDSSSQECLLESGGPTLEPVHSAHVDATAWREELERVGPALRAAADPVGEAGGWRSTLRAARRLCLEIQGSGLPSEVPERARACCGRWREELARLRDHEGRVNAAHCGAAAELVRLRDGATAEAERLATLQASVAVLSEALSSLAREAEGLRAEVAENHDERLDPEQLPRLRKALQRLQDEDRQLDVRARLLQSDAFSRPVLR